MENPRKPLAIPRSAPCPCESGVKYKACCRPKHRSAAKDYAPKAKPRGFGMADSIAYVAQPLLEVAGEDVAAINKALHLGMLFWNMGILGMTLGRDEMVEALFKLEADLCKNSEDRVGFRKMAKLLLDRFAGFYPGAAGLDVEGALAAVESRGSGSFLGRLIKSGSLLSGPVTGRLALLRTGNSIGCDLPDQRGVKSSN